MCSKEEATLVVVFSLTKKQNPNSTLLLLFHTMNTEENKSKIDDVVKAIERVVAGGGSVIDSNGNKGIDLLAIVKKVSRNRQKGEPLE